MSSILFQADKGEDGLDPRVPADAMSAELGVALNRGRGFGVGESLAGPMPRQVTGLKNSPRTPITRRVTHEPSGGERTTKVNPRHVRRSATDPTRVKSTLPRSTSAANCEPLRRADRVPLSGDLQLANAAMKAASEVDDVRLEEVARAMSLYEHGQVGNDLENLASKIIDSLVKSEP